MLFSGPSDSQRTGLLLGTVTGKSDSRFEVLEEAQFQPCH